MKPEPSWVPLKQAVFIVVDEGLASDLHDKPLYELTEAEIIETGTFSVPLSRLAKILEDTSGANRAEISTSTSTLLFYFTDGAIRCFSGTPWAILEDRPEMAIEPDPRMDAELLFSKGPWVRTTDQEAWRSAKQLEAVRKATGLVWRQYMLRAFDRAVSTGAVVLYARTQVVSAPFDRLPADVWPVLDVVDWENGVAIGVDGTAFWSIQAEFSTISDSSVGSLQEAPRATIHEAIKVAYDTAQAAGGKPPNIRELPAAVLPLLEAKGYRTSAHLIMKIGSAAEYALRRRSRGKTVLSERGARPR